METIRVTTWMDAPMERCFKLATSIDLHLASAAQTQEKAIGSVTSGLITEGQTVQWQGRHFGQLRTHTSKIDGWRPYSYFREVMVEGSFARFEHEHHFAVMDDGTRMRDEIRFSAPHGVLGKFMEKMVLRRHLIKMLRQRNVLIKRAAESEEWRKYLERTGTVTGGREAGLVNGWDKRSVLQRG
ncbi:SRPBCC family protein [Edaphobacter sp. DSM 109919]|uniref:SRPBCC family protein n=1 Tax=Edaphobacter paludis TaxID=3035702 RepID=A0AAU7CXX7_9BACT